MCLDDFGIDTDTDGATKRLVLSERVTPVLRKTQLAYVASGERCAVVSDMRLRKVPCGQWV